MLPLPNDRTGFRALSAEVLQLLEHRESEAVPPWAAGRLARLLGAKRSSALRVLPAAAARRTDAPAGSYAVAPADDDSAAFVPIGDDEALDRAIRTRQPVRCEMPAERWLVPLCCAQEARYVIDLHELDAGVADKALAEELVSLVSAYYDLLADAELDPLTRMANRRLFYSQVGSRLERWSSQRSEQRFLAVADIDHFKRVNDTYGHLYGDEILIHFAGVMRKSFRATDLLYRFGGEEFVMVFGVRRGEDGPAVLERFRRTVEAYDFPRIGRITASIGFTAIGNTVVPATTLVDQADQAVYYAKRNGRNRVCQYQALVAEGAMQAPAETAAGEVTLF
ncbi:MAG TPA: GGDEF domain-containing protein [Burkholderiales bacterium]